MNLMPTRLEDLTARAECDGVQQLVVGAIVEHDGRILLLRRPGNDFMGGIWELPSGKVDEVEEETGLRVTGVNRYIPCMRGAPRWRDNASSLRAHPSRAGGTSRRRRQSRNPGLVPACAGITGHRTRRPLMTGTHPRVRGEHCGVPKRGIEQPGSSPRARGAHSPDCVRDVGARLIPACAGEHVQTEAEWLASVGSSPRARGAHGAASRWEVGRRLIPACAGSTRTGCPARTCVRAHPRARGEHPVYPVSMTRPRGSSPRARGAHSRRLLDESVSGLIPACAGSTEQVDRRSGASKGSSPRARGAPCGGRDAEDHRGLIPACAGSTPSAPGVTQADPAHPRVRGEHGRAPGPQAPGRGSSPRARGALLRGGPQPAGEGLIPACAGSTAALSWSIS